MEGQAPAATSVGYLLMLDAKTTDCKELAALVQESKCFVNLPIKLKPRNFDYQKIKRKETLKSPTDWRWLQLCVQEI